MRPFQDVKSAYEELYVSMLRSGKPTWKPTEKGYWGMAVSDEVHELLRQLNMGSQHKLLDLGSGDGKVVLIAAALGMDATGIEHDKELHDIAESMRKKLRLPATFINADFNDHSWKGFHLVFSNPDQHLDEEKLQTELTGRLVVYGPHYHPNSLRKHRTLDIQGTLISVFGKE
ncbi:hypothetical protein COY28_02200 [Candidatus Woesearchaeota archaeon CG_4_10_14_0_2_um_filter_57_5]|nr:MAG: hypothetical protein AUJ68_06005 [Candidatus Woesearchaeota archaeon CG1_02_57_44]PIN68310.1 MAG: hypothetical protein COV94_05375 [Candidatus Woesearchaeota archaeon CG11_big_fil_rev_8_21_14_0_20_57_5]PIZ54968.1 MAG: hypothetical protein COY28_02200 [Candidatus Woesearchaeota archaeon CG_4_10_14_0_2_um_filter_57_5]